MKSLQISTILFLLFNIFGHSHAALISNWHNSNDTFGGLRQSELSPDIYYAATDKTTYNPNDTYDFLAGYHHATNALLALSFFGMIFF